MKYTFFWLTGNKEILEGETPEEALTLSGRSAGALRALDFYAEGEENSYHWDEPNHKWSK